VGRIHGIRDYFAGLPRIASLREAEAIERMSLAARNLSTRTYEVLRESAARYGDAPAQSLKRYRGRPLSVGRAQGR
jgi:hypothetical protein